MVIVFNVSLDESQSFEEWFQDLQLSVNECFENPESRTDVETSLQRLTVSGRMIEEIDAVYMTPGSSAV